MRNPLMPIRIQEAVRPGVFFWRWALTRRRFLPCSNMPACRSIAVCPGERSTKSRRDIDQLEEVWRNAVLTGNVAVMDGLLADDYIGITPNGMLQTKEEALAWLRNQRRHITALELSDSKVRFYGSTALVTSFAHVTGINAEGVAIGTFATRGFTCATRRASGRSSVLRPAAFACPARTGNCAGRHFLAASRAPLQWIDARAA